MSHAIGRVAHASIPPMKGTMIDTQNTYTLEQWLSLTPDQKRAVRAVGEFLAWGPFNEAEISDDKLCEIFNVVRCARGCVPYEEIGDDPYAAVRSKFACIYQPALDLARRELMERGVSVAQRFRVALVIEARIDEVCSVVILNVLHPCYYLHEEKKAWKFSFITLADIADEVLRIKAHLLRQVSRAAGAAQHVMCIEIADGVVKDVVNVPAGIQVVVVDYDTEGVEREELQISPLNGECCCITEFSKERRQ